MSAPEGYVPAFGVPYARAVIEGRKEFKQCPNCGELIGATQRKDFESFSGREYAVHYEQQHALEDGWLNVDGEWFQPVTW